MFLEVSLTPPQALVQKIQSAKEEISPQATAEYPKKEKAVDELISGRARTKESQKDKQFAAWAMYDTRFKKKAVGRPTTADEEAEDAATVLQYHTLQHPNTQTERLNPACRSIKSSSMLSHALSSH
jgi:hypothetical protein